MNAKELRQAAERLKQEFDADADSPYPDASDIAVQLEQNDIACLFTHILSTVRDDDDEPLDRRWQGSGSVEEAAQDREDHARAAEPAIREH